MTCSGLSGAKECKSCRSLKMLKNGPTLAIVAVHTAENEPLKIWEVIQFNIYSPPQTSQRVRSITRAGAVRLLLVCAPVVFSSSQSQVADAHRKTGSARSGGRTSSLQPCRPTASKLEVRNPGAANVRCNANVTLSIFWQTIANLNDFVY